MGWMATKGRLEARLRCQTVEQKLRWLCFALAVPHLPAELRRRSAALHHLLLTVHKSTSTLYSSRPAGPEVVQIRLAHRDVEFQVPTAGFQKKG